MTVQNDSAALCYFHPCTTFAILWGTSSIGSRIWSEIGVRSAQKMQADPRLPVGARLERLELARLLGQVGILLTSSKSESAVKATRGVRAPPGRG